MAPRASGTSPAGAPPVSREREASPEAGTGAASDASVPAADSASWAAIVNQLEISGAARMLANHCVLLGRRGGVVRLGIDPRNAFVRTQGQVDKLAQALSKYFGETVRIEFESTQAGLETPAQAEQRAEIEQLDAARQSLETDPAVQVLRETFGATLVPESVRPVK